MWPYTIRLNSSRVMAFITFSILFYVLYWSLTPSELKRSPVREISDSGEVVPEPLHLENDPFQINLRDLLIAAIQAAEAGGREVYRIRKGGDGSDEGQNLKSHSKGLTREGAKEMVTAGDYASHKVMVHGLSATFSGLQIISEESHADDDSQEVVKPFGQNDPLILPEELHALPRAIHVPVKQLTVWIDPLDATQEYTETDDDGLLKYVTTMVCVALNGLPVMGVVHKPFEHETYWAWKGYGMSRSLKELIDNRSSVTKNRSSDVVIVSRSHPGQVDQYIRSHLPEAQIIHAGGAGYKILEVIAGNADVYLHNTLIKKWDICAPDALTQAAGGKFSTLKGQSVSYSGESDFKNEDGVLAAASFTQHHKFFSKFRSETHA